MDVAAVSTIMAQSKVKETAGVMILDKVMDVAKQNATAINELITDSSVPSADPQLGRFVDKYA